jgi:hypothetical protein
MLYCLYTLADITATGQYHGGEPLLRNQQQNFDTILQTLGLKGNVYFEQKPIVIKADIFGRAGDKCWYFEWKMEIEELFQVDDDPIALLKDLFEYIPYIKGLTDTVQFEPSVFKQGQNILFAFKQ